MAAETFDYSSLPVGTILIDSMGAHWFKRNPQMPWALVDQVVMGVRATPDNDIVQYSSWDANGQKSHSTVKLVGYIPTCNVVEPMISSDKTEPQNDQVVISYEQPKKKVLPSMGQTINSDHFGHKLGRGY